MSDIFEIDDSDLLAWSEVLKQFERDFPKESKRVMSKVGNEAKKIVKAEIKNSVGTKTGNYLKSIKRGKVFLSDNGEWTVRVFPSYKIAPHAHLIEYGHRLVKNGEELGYVHGKRPFERAGRALDREFHRIVEQELDKELSKI
jgi:hypothetical protein